MFQTKCVPATRAACLVWLTNLLRVRLLLQHRVRPRREHVLARGATLPGGVRHRSHQGASRTIASECCCRFLKYNTLLFMMQMGTTAIGIRTKEGVVLAVEKRLTSPLLEPGRLVADRSC
jgi:hypothetical protein